MKHLVLLLAACGSPASQPALHGSAPAQPALSGPPYAGLFDDGRVFAFRAHYTSESGDGVPPGQPNRRITQDGSITCTVHDVERERWTIARLRCVGDVGEPARFGLGTFVMTARGLWHFNEDPPESPLIDEWRAMAPTDTGCAHDIARGDGWSTTWCFRDHLLVSGTLTFTGDAFEQLTFP